MEPLLRIARLLNRSIYGRLIYKKNLVASTFLNRSNGTKMGGGKAATLLNRSDYVWSNTSDTNSQTDLVPVWSSRQKDNLRISVLEKAFNFLCRSSGLGTNCRGDYR
jgi:hypothetical protein